LVARSPGRCAITEVTTRLHTEVQLPELQVASPEQQAAFDRYLRALSDHEQGHVQIGRDAAQAIDQGIGRCLQRPIAPRWNAKPMPWATGCCRTMWHAKNNTTRAPATVPLKARGWTDHTGGGQ